MAISLTMRRSIVALSFLCFFSSAFRFLFSRLADTRYSRARCFLSHSLPAHTCQRILQCCPVIFPTFAWRRLVNAGNILVPFSLFLHGDRLSVGWLTEPLAEPGGIGPSRISWIPQHEGQVEENRVSETDQ